MVTSSRNGAKTSQLCQKPEAYFENPSLVKEMRKMAAKTGEWGPNARTGLIKKQREKDMHARDKGWMRRGYFG